MPPASDSEGVSLYVHVPFCARACPYCDFDFEVGRRPDDVVWLDGLRREIDARVGPARPAMRTVYLGGGTPSLLGPAGLARVLELLAERFDLDAVEEVTVELNPEHVDAALLEALRNHGVDRVSLGLQSTSTNGLRVLGRAHDRAAGLRATEAAVAAGLRVGADLIVGWPGQRRRELFADVDAVVAAGVEHVSVYALTIEPGTPWEALERRGARTRPDPDRQADLLSAVESRLHERGFSHYEVAGYARSPAARARHNLGYWTWRDVLALGPSAASVRHAPDGSVQRRTNRRGLRRWAAAPEVADVERLPARTAAAEGLWLGLRRLDGLALPAFLARFSAVDEAWVRQRVARQVARGNLRFIDDRLSVAPGRWLWHDAIGVDLVEEPVQAATTRSIVSAR